MSRLTLQRCLPPPMYTPVSAPQDADEGKEGGRDEGGRKGQGREWKGEENANPLKFKWRLIVPEETEKESRLGAGTAAGAESRNGQNSGEKVHAEMGEKAPVVDEGDP